MQTHIGISREELFHTNETHSAHSYGNTGVHVVATVALIAFVEQCAGLLLKTVIKNDEISVGSIVNIKHRAVATLGTPIRVQCEICAYEQNKVLFSSKVYQNDLLILEGTHGRVVIAKRSFSSLSNLQHQRGV